MSWQQAQKEDLPRITRFLADHIQTSMFPLANLRDFGLRGTDPRALNVWTLGDGPRAVFAITNEGMVLTQCPDCSDDELMAAIDLIRGRPLFGIAAEAAQARRIMQMAGWANRPATLNSDEPGFTLDLTQLVVPDTTGAMLEPLSGFYGDIAEGWRTDYLIEAMDFDPARARKQARKDFVAYTQRNSHRILLIDGQPVAMTGFNARLPDVVQIGGVYTPPELRGRGYARLAVGLHLLEANASGVSRAVLFAASDSAARAYMAIGFKPAGQFSLILFKDPKDPA
jgi:RimJ/RimL family protein N-acetyltransferase